MTKWLLVLLSAAVLSGATPAQEKEVMTVMKAWIQATTSQDIPALKKLLHDDLIYTHSTGKIQNKAEVIQDIEANNGPIGIELSETETKVYTFGHDTALVTSMVVVRNRPRNPGQNAGTAPGAAGGNPNAAAGRRPNRGGLFITHLLVKGPSGWQLATRQAMRFAPPPDTPAAAQ
jgi:ketosteroid isomerase-like protein